MWISEVIATGYAILAAGRLLRKKGIFSTTEETSVQ
jgi:hypothetical protein